MNRTLLAVLTFLCFSCKDEGTPPPPYVPSITLEAVDASCTEAWLRASTSVTPATVRLLRDNQRVADLRILTADSLLIDDVLLPNHQYSYQLQKLDNDSNVVETSTSVQLTTMDTTSHDFTWEVDTLGDGNSSVLYDVAIIDDTLAYAVGAIYKMDSLGNWDPLPYNLVKWDGHNWELKRVTVQTRYGLVTAPLEGIFAFAPNNIWVVATDPIHGDGQNWVDYDIRTILSDNNLSVSKAWGSSSSDMYFVGRSGNIVRYASGTWQRVESGTTLPFQDIWGAADIETGERQVLAVASDKFHLGGKDLVRLSGNSALQSNDSIPIAISLSGIWFEPNRRYFLAGDGIYEKKSLSSAVWQFDYFSWQLQYYAYAVRGNNTNDVIVAGEAGVIAHWNGKDWKKFDGSQLVLGHDRLWSVSVRGNSVVAVGYRYQDALHNYGLIYKGRR